MTRTILTTLTALSLTLIAAQANASYYLKLDSIPGECNCASGNRPVVAGPAATESNREWILIESMMHDAGRGPDAGSDAGAGRDAAGG